MPFPLLWAQNMSRELPDLVQWLLVWGEPDYTDARWYGGFMTWAKLLGLVCLLAWLLTQVVTALRGSTSLRASSRTAFNARLTALAAFLILAILTAFLFVLDQTGTFKLPAVGGSNVPTIFYLVLQVVLFLFVEWSLWSGGTHKSRIVRVGLVLLVHLAFALGFYVSYLRLAHIRNLSQITTPWMSGEWDDFRKLGLRWGATYAGLVILAFFGARLFAEALHVRWRRLFSIGWHTFVESNRRMAAPWVVLILFVVFLAFTNWFLGRSRTAELAPMFVSTLALVTTVSVTWMVLILAPISIPNDIRYQTIYTVVSKPVRRIELIWGRLLGYMALVTGVLAVMGGISLYYINRIVDKRIESAEATRIKAEQAGRIEEARQLDDDVYQLRTRRSARVPVYGSLVFTDSYNRPRKRGIDVGQEQVTRSHIEGSTPSKATWRFGIVPDPENPKIQLDRRIPVDKLLDPGTLEAVENQYYRVRYEQNQIRAEQQSGSVSAAKARDANNRLRSLEEQASRFEQEAKKLRDRDADLARRARALETEGKKSEARVLREQQTALHSRPVPVEMVFSVFRTTKGDIGQNVRASLIVTNPMRADLPPARDFFPVHEYYTIPRVFPARMLVGSMGYLIIDVQCLTPNQFLGMAEQDLFILSRQGDFWSNYIRGLMGIWLQALVVTAVGLFAGTFLSWPVALLLTIAVYGGGQIAIGFLDQFAHSQVLGGGPFESLIRLLNHENLQSDLAPTAGVLAARTFDMFMTPLLSRLVYVVPNLSALDVTNTVAAGFAVTGWTLFDHVLLGLGYALPITGAAYFILKNREVAA